MQLLLITGSYPPMKCGVGSYTRRLATALGACEDVEVTVLTDQLAIQTEERDAVKVLPIVNSWTLKGLFKIAAQVIKLNPDIVHIQYPTQGYSGRLPMLLPLVMWLLAKPCVQTWHEPVLGRSGLLLAIGLKMLITVRKDIKASLPEFILKSLEKVETVWIPSASLLPTHSLSEEERHKIRQSYAAENSTLLVYFGFVAPLKGIESLLNIVAKTEMRLLLVSDFHVDDDYHQSLLNKIEVLGIASRVSVTGFLADQQLTSVLACADAVVLPFRDGAGAWNTSIDGALAQGGFVLSTSLGEGGYDKGKNIYYAKPGDVEEMISAIGKYAGYRLEAKPSTFEWTDIAHRHVAIYSQIVKI